MSDRIPPTADDTPLRSRALADAHALIRQAYADAGEPPYDLEAQPRALLEVYEILLAAMREATALYAGGVEPSPALRRATGARVDEVLARFLPTGDPAFPGESQASSADRDR